MTTAGETKRRALCTWLCSLSSIALLVMLVALAVHIRIALGRWPQFGENYDSFLFNLHGARLFGIAMLTVFVCPVAWFLLLFFRHFRISWRIHLAQALVYGLGWLLIWLAGKFDPTPFTNWFLD